MALVASRFGDALGSTPSLFVPGCPVFRWHISPRKVQQFDIVISRWVMSTVPATTRLIACLILLRAIRLKTPILSLIGGQCTSVEKADRQAVSRSGPANRETQRAHCSDRTGAQFAVAAAGGKRFGYLFRFKGGLNNH